MARPQCDRCGNKYISQQHLQDHRENCSGKGRNEPESPEQGTDSTKKAVPPSKRAPLVTGATGTVSTFNEDKGFGFVTTADLTNDVSNGSVETEDAFFHISDLATGWVEEGDRLEFDIVENDEGLRCEDVEVIERDRDRETYEEPEDGSSSRRPGFGHVDDETKYGTGVAKPSNLDVEDFKDERKFR